jgi:serine/tyrosine/threonine adenylyltransferase
LSIQDIENEHFTAVFSGKSVLENTSPYAMSYAGHQFGNWAGQLGDGRAINLFEIKNKDKIWALQLKGAGKTPYSRTADGLAVLRSSIREFLCSEAMHHLNIPTTRALSLIETGDLVLRDMLYDGNPAYEKGAIVCRVAESFVRFGNFELFASRNDLENLKKLADYSIKYFYQNIENEQNKYEKFFESVAQKTLDLIIEWERVGFVHGVMNTDNMSILGLTIDFGPYGWLDNYDPNWTPNTTDFQNKRYRFGNQVQVALWNLVQLANALFPLTNKKEAFVNTLENFKKEYPKKHTNMMRKKLGLLTESKNDILLIADLEENLELSAVDYTIFFRLLSNLNGSSDGLEMLKPAFYNFDSMTQLLKNQWDTWFLNYAERIKTENNLDRKSKMDGVNPAFILRNYIAQLVIEEAEKGNYSLLKEVAEGLKNPYSDNNFNQKWFQKRPDWALNKVGCSALSCSS